MMDLRKEDGLTKPFRTNDFGSLRRNLNKYEFKKVTSNGKWPDYMVCFRNELFVQGQPELMQELIARRLVAKRLENAENATDQMREGIDQMLSTATHLILLSRSGE